MVRSIQGVVVRKQPKKRAEMSVGFDDVHIAFVVGEPEKIA